MLVVNLGTRGPQDAANFVEYCNHPGGTALSELRRTHGWDKPHNVKFWCLGNEMDGPWHTGAETPEEYGRVAARAAKIMRWADDSIEIAASGSSRRDLPTLGAWDETVLKHAFAHVDHIAIHTYLNNWKDDASAFLASPECLVSHTPPLPDPHAAGLASHAAGIGRKCIRWRMRWWSAASSSRSSITPTECAAPASPNSQGDRPDHDRDRRCSLAPDDLLSFRADELLRARRCVEGID